MPPLIGEYSLNNAHFNFSVGHTFEPLLSQPLQAEKHTHAVALNFGRQNRSARMSQPRSSAADQKRLKIFT
jgi:hypothetical protein